MFKTTHFHNSPNTQLHHPAPTSGSRSSHSSRSNLFKSVSSKPFQTLLNNLTPGALLVSISPRKLLRQASISKCVILPCRNESIRVGLHVVHKSCVSRCGARISAGRDRGQEPLVEAQRTGGDNDAAAGVELVDGSVQCLRDGEGADEPRVSCCAANTLFPMYQHCRKTLFS
jgi:hypothetical protein